MLLLSILHTIYPSLFLALLLRAFTQKSVQPITPAFISELLSQSMTSFDQTIAGDVLDLFLSNYFDKQIERNINDIHTSGVNYKKARLCIYGTTALVALIDPDHENLWLANLGDCQAGLSLVTYHYGERALRFLILSSDGLTGPSLCQGPGQQRIIKGWARNLKKPVAENSIGKSSNMALRTLWHALCEDNDSVSRVLTLDMEASWIDDTSIIVQVLLPRPSPPFFYDTIVFYVYLSATALICICSDSHRYIY